MLWQMTFNYLYSAVIYMWHIKYEWFCIFVSSFFFIDVLEYFMYAIMLGVFKDIFISLIKIFIIFSFWPYCLAQDLSWNARGTSFPHVSYGHLKNVSFISDKGFQIPSFLRVFPFK